MMSIPQRAQRQHDNSANTYVELSSLYQRLNSHASEYTCCRTMVVRGDNFCVYVSRMMAMLLRFLYVRQLNENTFGEVDSP